MKSADESEAMDPGPESQRTRAPAVNRAIAILRVLSDSPVPLGVNMIAREVGIVPSTCHHILRALEVDGIVAVDAIDKRYSIGLGLISLARGSLSHLFKREEVQQELDALAREFPCTMSLTQLDNKERLVVVAIAEAEQPFGIRVELGQRLPAWLSATGRLMAAYSGLPHRELRKRFESVRWDRAPRFEEWVAQVDETRLRGIGIDEGNLARGLSVHAAPVFGNGQMRGTVAALAVSGQIDGNIADRLHVRLKEVGARLSS